MRRYDMFNMLKQMQAPLQKQALIRIGLGALSLALLVVLLVITRDIYLWFPCAAAGIVFSASAFILCRCVALGEYVIISGVCSDLGATTLKRRMKYVIMQTDTCQLKVMLQNRRRKIPTGATIMLYIAKSTPVYERDGLQVVCNYIALDVQQQKPNIE